MLPSIPLHTEYEKANQWAKDMRLCDDVRGSAWVGLTLTRTRGQMRREEDTEKRQRIIASCVYSWVSCCVVDGLAVPAGHCCRLVHDMGADFALPCMDVCRLIADAVAEDIANTDTRLHTQGSCNLRIGIKMRRRCSRNGRYIVDSVSNQPGILLRMYPEVADAWRAKLLGEDIVL